MTDCADIYSFTLAGSRKDNFLNGFRDIVNGAYARQSGFSFVNNIYRQDIVNIISDPQSMDMRVPESLASISKIGITKKRKGIAENKKNAKEIAVDGKKETIEDGKIKALRGKSKIVREPKYAKGPLDVSPWEKIIPPELHPIYTLSAEIHRFEQEFNLRHTFRNVGELNEHLKQYMGDDYLENVAISPPSTFRLISEISKIFREKLVNKGNVPIELTESELVKIADEITADDEFDMESGTIGFFSDLLVGLLPVTEQSRVIQKVEDLYTEAIFQEMREEARTGIPGPRGYEINYPRMTAVSEATLRQINDEERRLRGIRSSDDNYRDPFGITSTETGSGRLQRMFGVMSRANSSESGGGSSLAGPVFLPTYEPPPRRDLRPGLPGGLPGVFGPGYGLDETPRGP